MNDRPATVRIAYNLVKTEVPLANAIATLRAHFDPKQPENNLAFLPGDIVLLEDDALEDPGSVPDDEDETYVAIAYVEQVDTTDDTIKVAIIDNDGEALDDFAWVAFNNATLVDRRKTK